MRGRRCGDPKDCSETGAGCMVGVCDPSDGSCVGTPAPDGGPCDDGDRCTVGDSCAAGECVAGEPLECSHLDSACTRGRCDPLEGACTAAPIADGTSCDDGDPCTPMSACQAGVCTGTPLDCSALDAECTVGACEVQDGVGACAAVPANEDAACDDQDPCTTGSTCAQGVCVRGAPLDCSHLDGDCVAGTCVAGTCVEGPANSGMPCDDENHCTVGDLCRSGVCRGEPKACASSSVCSVGTCDPIDGSCGQVPVVDGTSCGAVDLCTLGGTCLGGVCAGGTQRDCSSLDATCKAGVCDPGDGSCIQVPANEGLPCDDGLACTSATVCTGGVCGGGTAPACSMTPDGCCPNSCDEFNDADCACPGIQVGGSCVYAPTTASQPTNAAALTACQALGTGWGLCSPTVLCQQPVYDYLMAVGCTCSGGAATCGCGSSANIYVHASGSSNSHWIRGPNFPTCISGGVSCTLSGSEVCGTPLCCKAAP